jgi:hypothetical protein
MIALLNSRISDFAIIRHNQFGANMARNKNTINSTRHLRPRDGDKPPPTRSTPSSSSKQMEVTQFHEFICVGWLNFFFFRICVHRRAGKWKRKRAIHNLVVAENLLQITPKPLPLRIEGR